ncbi:Peptide methionine sulfoxide reductase B5 [Dimargaris xerosporica]|nr:Peptide methionine sulfoxide reductase B5 [Dimargaris xerosporica]
MALLASAWRSQTRRFTGTHNVLYSPALAPTLSLLSSPCIATPFSQDLASPRRTFAITTYHSMPTTTAPNAQPKSEDEWRAILTPEQFRVLRLKGTERPGTGKYDKFDDQGIYHCAACDTPLYKSTTKFNSGCGWPAFFEALPNAINRHSDRSMGMERIEITCASCGGHLGHVFKGEGFDTPTDERHCVNSISLKFSPEPKS